MEKENLFDINVEGYEQWFKTNDKLFDSELTAIKQLIPAGGNGIEIGAGTGIFASKLGIKYGVEPSEKMAAEAIKRGIHIIKAKAENLPIEDEIYDFALMVTVDCFLENVLKAFLEIRRVLVGSGIFVIAFLDRATPLGELYEKNKHLNNSYKDANFHSVKEISKLLEEAGFEIQGMRQTIYTLDNKTQKIKNGTGKGLFAVIKAKKH